VRHVRKISRYDTVRPTSFCQFNVEPSRIIVVLELSSKVISLPYHTLLQRGQWTFESKDEHDVGA
jgi:hypothetical protein